MLREDNRVIRPIAITSSAPGLIPTKSLRTEKHPPHHSPQLPRSESDKHQHHHHRIPTPSPHVGRPSADFSEYDDETTQLISTSSPYTPPDESEGGRKHIINLVILEAAFFGVFIAFAFTQNLTSSLVSGILGYWSLAVLYGTFAFTSLVIAAPFVAKFTPKWSMLIGAACYSGFTLAMMVPSWYTMLPASASVGFGAGLLWIGQGAYLARLSANYAEANMMPTKATMGNINGLFFGIFQINIAFSNILGGVMLSQWDVNEGSTRYTLFTTFFCIAVVGVVVFFFLGPEESKTQQQQQQHQQQQQQRRVKLYVPENPVEGEDEEFKKGWQEMTGGDTTTTTSNRNQTSTMDFIVSTIKMPSNPKLGLLLVLMVYMGMEQGFIVADFTSEIITPTKGPEWIGWVFCLIALTNCVSTLILGKVCDVWGKKIVFAAGFLANFIFFASYLIFIILREDYLEIIAEHWIILFISGVALGIGDAVWNTILPIVLSTFFMDQAETAFANLRFWQAMGYVIVFAWGPFIGFEIKCILLSIVLVLGMICLTVLHLRVISIDDIASENESEDLDLDQASFIGEESANLMEEVYSSDEDDDEDDQDTSAYSSVSGREVFRSAPAQTMYNKKAL